jgi:tRNA pseudouridine55 synthase
MSKNTNQPPAYLIVDKPPGVTSHDIVVATRRLLPNRAVGHAGTLDPDATGVLLILIGSATRLVEYIHQLPKTYFVMCQLGATSTTDDASGHITPASTHRPKISDVETIVRTHLGTQLQTPPVFSAVKFKGKKLYHLARTGKTHEARAGAGERVRTITIHEIKNIQYKYPVITFRVACSSGTYIRSLVRDVGKELKTGAFLTSLRRLSIGGFTVKQAVQPQKLSTTSLSLYLRPASELVEHLDPLPLSPNNVAKFKQGRNITLTQPIPSKPIAILDDHRNLIGIGRASPTNPLLLLPKKVLI